MSSFTILCTSDLHLGRRPARVPVEVDGVSTSDAWRAVVRAARQRAVDAVLMAGDIVDADNQLYEAFGPLQDGISRLADDGIWTLAVGGNHDHGVMERLAEVVQSDRWCFLGRAGEWERRDIAFEDGRELAVWGWSFPSRHVHTSPFETFPDDEGAGTPAVGMMHAEFGMDESDYAPVARGDVAGSGVPTWVFGHRHDDQVHEVGNGNVVYPGSPQPLDPTDTGKHGATLLELGADGRVEVVEQIQTASLAYNVSTISVSGVENENDFEREMTRSLEREHRQVVESQRNLQWVVHRASLEGRAAGHRHFDEWVDRLRRELRPRYEGVRGSVDDIDIQTRPEHDLESLAEGNDPPGELARMLLALEARRDPSVVGDATEQAIDSDVLETLLPYVRRELTDDIFQSNAYAPLRSDEETNNLPDRDQVVELLCTAGWELLDELMSQRDVEDGANIEATMSDAPGEQ